MKACIAFFLYLDDVTNEYLKKRGLVITDWFFGEGMETNSEGEKAKKERNDVLSVCLFAHLLCVHIVLEQIFVIPLFLLPSHLHC